jgi:solute carrier family 25 (mitochondrial iron transporter), member 28/37
MISILAACIASLVARICVHPADTLKTRLQALKATRSFSVIQVLVNIIKEEGPLALYQVLPVTLLFALPGLTVYLGVYDYVCGMMVGLGFERAAVISSAIGAICAEMLSALIWTPMEIVKSREQVLDRHQRTIAMERKMPVQLYPGSIQ